MGVRERTVHLTSSEHALVAAPRLAWPTVLVAALSVGAFVALAMVPLGRAPLAWILGLQVLAAYVAFTPMHDAAHHAVARRSLLNEVVGWVTAAVLCAPFAAFRVSHLAHHRATNHEADDPDMWSARGPALFLPLRWATQDFAYYAWYVRRFRSRPARERAQVAVGALLLLVAIVALCISHHGTDLALRWLVPSRIAIAVLAFWFDFVPHRPHTVLAAEDPFRATSVIDHAFLTPLLLGQNYHLLHHLYPAVPFYRYGLVWAALRERLIERGAQARRFWGSPAHVASSSG